MCMHVTAPMLLRFIVDCCCVWLLLYMAGTRTVCMHVCVEKLYTCWCRHSSVPRWPPVCVTHVCMHMCVTHVCMHMQVTSMMGCHRVMGMLAMSRALGDVMIERWARMLYIYIIYTYMYIYYVCM